MTYRMQERPIGESITPPVLPFDDVVIVHVFVSYVDFLLTESALAFLGKPQRGPLHTPDGFTHSLYAQLLSVDYPVRVEGVVVPLDFGVPDNFHIRQGIQR